MYLDHLNQMCLKDRIIRIIKDKTREIIESDLATLQDKCRDIKLVESLLQYKTRPEYNFIFSGGYEVKSFLD